MTLIAITGLASIIYSAILFSVVLIVTGDESWTVIFLLCVTLGGVFLWIGTNF